MVLYSTGNIFQRTKCTHLFTYMYMHAVLNIHEYAPIRKTILRTSELLLCSQNNVILFVPVLKSTQKCSYSSSLGLTS